MTTWFEPGDPRYEAKTVGANRRWRGNPLMVVVPRSTPQVIDAVRVAVETGMRIGIRSGGHCYEDFAFNENVDLLLDLSGMARIEVDLERRAFCVEAGASIGSMCSTLYRRWGVTVPAGTCASVGVGGQICGGGYGILSRLHGLTADHLAAVEVVVADDPRHVRAVVATCETLDPHRELWWAHCGAGGGSFGVVTRFWLRSPQAHGEDPAAWLPRPPDTIVVSDFRWPWEKLLTRADGSVRVTALIQGFGAWHERHSAPQSRYVDLFSSLTINHRTGFGARLRVLRDSTTRQWLLDDFVEAATLRMDLQPEKIEHRLSWLQAIAWLGVSDPTLRSKCKSSYHRRSLSPEQSATIYRYLTDDGYGNSGALVQMDSYGGQINAVSAWATAVSHRDSVIKLQFQTYWHDATDDGVHLEWIRQLYSDVYAATGGVPVPGDSADGCYINYPDSDLSDAEQNTSGVPWHTLYYKEHYPALQRIKGCWDPHDVFRHRQSVRLPEPPPHSLLPSP
ncbi:FAD-binding oxidoreductase [Streptomyces sp. NPDC020799]|uniref:FAD-binding oxidoreductase n=1 Tax=Streptomyces sp. NPDC020799 TaxID=3365091 RepID=UPI0037AC7570